MKAIKYSDILKKKYYSWLELEKEIESLPTTKAIGNAFEEFVYAYFVLNAQKYQVAEVFTSADIPEKYKEKYKIANLHHQDAGVDGLIIRNDGKAVAYQCKFRTNRIKPTYKELTKFWSDGRYCDYLCTVANSSSISSLSDKHEQNMQVLAQDFDNLSEEFFKELYNLVNIGKLQKKEYYKPHKYQEKIIDDVIHGFKVEDRGKIIAACGTGKTLTSLWIVETMDVDVVLFLSPSITLVKQTLESWSDQAKKSFAFMCVCSDNTVSKSINDDESDIDISELGVPVTTNENKIAEFLNTPTIKRKYIFSTYQSADKIANATKIAKVGFDLTILDEAHRTAGLRSQFSLALENQYIQSKKRLFMTATERMVRPMLQRKAESNGEVIFSMDDESVYGPLLSRYNFGDAIKDKTISDYKIIISGVKESEVYNYISNNDLLSLQDVNEQDKTSSATSLYAKILLAKVIREYPVKKIISFHSTIQRAKAFVAENGEEISLRNVIAEFNEHLIEKKFLFIDNINCQIDSGKRAEILSQFKTREYSVLSNAKCLTEGVDVPIIDSVYFVDRKKSLVDIVQACGRALRTKKGVDKTAYFIVPILIPETSVAQDVLYSEEFEIVYNIIQALRDQDNRLEDWIDKLNKRYVKGQGIGQGGDDNNPIIVDVQDIDIQEFSEQLFAQIATVNANPQYRQPVTYGKGERKTGHARLFKTLGDYGFNSYIENLVDPTIAKYKTANVRTLKGTIIKINHNNVSHTKKIGLIEKDGSNYTLTPLGEKYLVGKITAKELFKRQLLRYSCSIEDSNLDRVLFPYRACLKILLGLDKDKLITFNEFAFCIYPMYDSSVSSIKMAIADIKYLRENYPNLQLANITNRTQLLSDLNSHYGTTLVEVDVWGTKPTTIKNQFIYFKSQLAVFEDIIDVLSKNIVLKPGKEKEVEKLLDMDDSIQNLSRIKLLAKYGEAF